MAIDTSAGAEPFGGADVRAITVQPVADPAPLGLAAFAMTTFALSIANTNVWGAGAFAALGLALVYGGFAQLLAGMWEFVRKNTFGALAFTSYGAFWITLLRACQVRRTGRAAQEHSGDARGLRPRLDDLHRLHDGRLAPGVRRGRTGVHPPHDHLRPPHHRQLQSPRPGMTKAAGWFGVATAAAAWYASFAGVTNETFKKTIIPVLPLAPKAN